jgi:hypothetical protein
MKRTQKIGAVFTLLVVSLVMVPMNLKAQEEESTSGARRSQKPNRFDVGGDLVSSYLWRGTKFGTGPAIQPYLEVAFGNFSMGGWGSYSFGNSDFAEADIYLSYGFDFGLSLGITDYYFPGAGSDYFDFSDSTGTHGLELNLGYEIKGLSVSANYMFNEAPTAGTTGGDMYFELGYAFNYFGIFLGAGDGWHTEGDKFAICNLGITSSKEIQITEKFSLPVSGSLIWNPEREQFHVVVGVSF